MTTRETLIAWCKDLQHQMREQIDFLRSGQLRVFKAEVGGDQTEVTDREIATLEERIAELDRLLASADPGSGFSSPVDIPGPTTM